MYYKLKPHITLRGWFGVPFSYINHQNNLVYKLSKSECDILNKCDGKNNFIQNDIIDFFLKREVIDCCTEGDFVENRQKYKFCANNCFSTVYWAITSNCNYNCKHCFMASDYKQSNSEFTLKECYKFLDSCEKCGIYNIILTGGEPFLHPNFFDIIHGATKRNINIKEILTNGSCITKQTIKKLKNTNINPLIKVSFDGVGCHDWMRGVKGAEKNTLSAINLLKSNGFKVQVQMCIHKNNINSIYPTAKLLDSLGIDKMRILRTCESPRWESHYDVSLGIREYYDMALNFIKQYTDSSCLMPIEIFKFMYMYPAYKKFSCIPVLKNGNKLDEIPACNEMRFCVNVSSSGNIVPCNRLMGYYQKYGIEFGNVKKDNLQQLLLESKYFQECSRTVIEVLKANPKCKKCKFLTSCYVGCRGAAAIFSGDLMAPDISNCIYFYEGYRNKTIEILSLHDYIEI